MPARFALPGLVAQLRSIEVEIEKIEAEILKWHRANEASRRLATIPAIGPITASAIAASAIAASVPDATLFWSGRQFAAWLGLTPKSHSSGGTERQVGSPSRATGISAVSWQSARPPSCGSLGRPTPARCGQPGRSNANGRRSSPSHWPTTPRGSPGR